MDLVFHHREFEYEVRSALGVWDRPVTQEDALRVTELDLWNFAFLEEDKDTLCMFTALTSLDINIGSADPVFWSSFPKMKQLYLCCWGPCVDLASFRDMADLERLWVSGGDFSDIDYLNLEALTGLKHLSYLDLHEFGTVDLRPLEDMPQLKTFEVRYAKGVRNIGAIGSMRQLEKLVLDGLYVDDLDFLDALPDTLRLEMCGIRVRGEVDPAKWKRFTEHDICEISVGDQLFDYIDLSALDP